MTNYDELKLIEELNEIDNYEIAEEHVRCFAISLEKKIAILKHNPHIKQLKSQSQGYSSSNRIKKVFTLK